MPNNKHVFLINEKTGNPKFNRQRGRKQDDKQEVEIPPQPKFIKDFQKENFRNDNVNFYSQRKLRNENRTVKFPKSIDLVRLFFHVVFNADLNKKFEQRYGLSPVEYSHFNKTVVFEIINETLFINFEKHIKQVIESPDETPYENKPFNLVSLILKFEFISSRYRLLTSKETGILLTLISSANTISKVQKETLLNFLREQNLEITYNALFPDILEIKNISKDQNKFIADNFDIVRMITSTRALRIRPGAFGPSRREFGFTIHIPDNITTVGVIDTGISMIEPFRNVLLNTAYDHTGNGAFWDEAGHGTMVAGLVILGDEFQITVKESYDAKAKVIAIKALHNIDDDINIPQLLNDIRDAKRQHGVRLFNMSLNIPFAKKYNDTYSQFAYELDKLAYEEDILIFISVGNFDSESLEDLVINETHPDHEYPTFFYNLNHTSQSHSCQNTNISEPSESLNNVSIGALAGNLEGGDNTDITPNNMYPAYYSRKFHFDYSQPINKKPLRRNQNNKHLNKPDFVFEGGDLFKYDAGIEILRSPLNNDDKFFGRSCGTSLSTPLVTSYAAEILNNYPSLKTQTVKALLINGASYYKKSNLPDFKTSTDSLLKSMVGFGKPQRNKLLSTDDNSIIFVIEDEIESQQILTIPIILPDYLKKSGNKLRFDISLCYSFLPVKDNHLNYLPIYMSFNLVKNIDIKTVAEKEQTEYGIKNGFSWSEDHHGIENRVFSNAQFKSYSLQPNDIQNLGDSIALGIRCLVKTEIPATHAAQMSAKKHPFSIVLSITELPEINASNQLYSTMIACNEIRNIVQAEGEVDIEVEA
jgi:hypothetical protein